MTVIPFRAVGSSLVAMQINVKTTKIQKGEEERRRRSTRNEKAWSHAISNSEDVPCTKWPPARRSKGVEKRCGLSEPEMWRVVLVEGPREARFLFLRYLRYFVRTKGRRARIRRWGPTTHETIVAAQVGGGWWRVWSVFRPRAGWGKSKNNNNNNTTGQKIHGYRRSRETKNLDIYIYKYIYKSLYTCIINVWIIQVQIHIMRRRLRMNWRNDRLTHIVRQYLSLMK